MQILNVQGAVEYRELKDLLDISDGKLAGHLKSLLDNDPPLITGEKRSYTNDQTIDRTRNVYTIYFLTKNGHIMFERICNVLINVIGANKYEI